MAFQPSASNFSTPRLVFVIVALAATLCLGAYHVRLLQIGDTFARPDIASAPAGPVLVEGAAGGIPVELPDGTRALVAQIEVRDRAPNKKGSSLLCSRVLVERLTIGGHPVAWDPAATKSATRPPLFGGGELGTLDLARQGSPLPLDKLGAYCDADALAKARHVQVLTLLPGDTATTVGCAKDGDVVPCRDGRDLLAGRSRAEAEGRVREGLFGYLFLAILLGCPSLVALTVLLSHRTVSLARPREELVS